MAKFNAAAAKAAGYSDEEISSFLASHPELEAASPTPEEPGLFDKTMGVLRTPQRGVKLLSDTIASTLPEHGNTKSTAANIAIGTPRALLETAGETASDLVSPETVALELTGATAVKALKPVAKLAFAPRLAKAGKAIEAVEHAAGARKAGDSLVKVGRTAEKARGEIDRIASTIEKFAASEKKPTARFLARQNDRLRLILDKFTKNPSARDNLGKDAVQKASRVKEIISKELNASVPGRPEAAQAFKYSKKRSEVIQALGKYANPLGKLGAAGAAFEVGRRLLK